MEAAGHIADDEHDEGLSGAKDPVVFTAICADGRMLLTLDRGFGDVRAYPPGSHPGTSARAQFALMDVAADRGGYVPTRVAKGHGLIPARLVTLAHRGSLERVGHGLDRIRFPGRQFVRNTARRRSS